jgi:uncharacterized protein YqhQ
LIIELAWCLLQDSLSTDPVLQSLTTRQPDEKMLEVAIAAFTAMRQAEGEM